MGHRIRMLVNTPENGQPPRAVLLLFAGGDGRVAITHGGGMKRLGRNFLVRTRAALANRGFVTAVVDAPKNKLTPPGLLGGYRATEAHAQDVAAVAETIAKVHPDLPVYAIGTSRGTVSAANAAVRLGGAGISGAVLTSSLVKKNSKGANIREVGLEEATVPLLFVHHTHDGCKVTRFESAQAYFNTLEAKGRAVAFKAISGGHQTGKPCKSQSHHGFLGVEGKALDAIAAWVVENLS